MAKGMKGTYFHNVDAKGRVIIPAKLRDALGKEFVMTLGVDNCLYLYSEEQWDIFTEKLMGLGNNKESVRNIKRFFQANAADCEIDSQGRTLISPQLRNSVNIEKEVVIIGNGEKAEIWSKAEWDKLQESPMASVEMIRKQLEDMDIDF